ncbi:hypothetical protein [Haloechinothrix halophila]|uniref:hypothetical protein n=1 Tax=Haloechinothrix halophila TaxID=1069073 RepID=UPI000551D9EE|nr:hypothetical protein [Haloechinothrix halophila]
MDQPLFDHYLFLALREVARGDVSMDIATGELRRYGAEVPARVADALADLLHGGYLRARVTDDRPWALLDLTPLGEWLLAGWLPSGCRAGLLHDTPPSAA